MKRNTILIIGFVILLLFLAVSTNQIREYFSTSLNTTALAIQQATLGEKLNSTLIPLPNNKKGILVHERELYGYSGQTPITITTTESI
jgi:hypothetical protein